MAQNFNFKLAYQLAALSAGVAMHAAVAQAALPSVAPYGDSAATLPDKVPLIAAGPGTQQAFTPQQIAALGRHAGGRLVILSAADAAYLKVDAAAPDQDPLDKMLPAWLPRLDEKVRSLVQASMTAGTPRTIPLTTMGGNVLSEGPPVAAIIIVPTPQQLNEDYYRRQTGVAFPTGVITPGLLQEGALYIAAHEATHWRLFQLAERSDGKIRNSEYGAETGAQEFVRNNPAFFPNLGVPNTARAMLLGRRALSVVTTGGSDDGHHYTAYLQPGDRIPERDRQQRLVDADRDMNRQIAVALYDAGQLQPEPADALRAALGRVTMPWAYTLATDKAHGSKFDLAADKTGVLAAYLQQTRREKIDADRALDRFGQTFQPVLDGSPSAEQQTEARQFMAQYGITQAALDKFVQSGMRLAAPEALSRVRYDLGKPESLSWSIAPGSMPYMAPEQTQLLCSDGMPDCAYPDKLLLSSHPLLQRTIAAVRQLQKAGAFARSPEQQAFAANLMAGVAFYRIPGSDDSQPAARHKAADVMPRP